MTKEYDLVILGGGTGGYVGAIRASQLGMKVAIVEDQKLGGTCLHKGCIPSKSLLQSAQLYRQMKSSDEFGLETSEITVNFSKIQERKNKIINQLHKGVQSLIKKGNIDIYHGFGRILGSSIFSPIPGTISVQYHDGSENTMLIPKNVLIATGSSPMSLPNLDVDGVNILTSDEALQLERLPKSMIIIGAGVIGIEWASLLIDLGTEVTVIENKDDILLTEDEEVRKNVKKSLSNRGVKFITKANIHTNSIISDNGTISMKYENEEVENSIEAEKVLLSVGRKPNIDDIGLSNTSIEVEHNAIVTNKMYQTAERHIYAIGDCIGGMQLAHLASSEAILAVEHMANQNPLPIDKHNVPSCIYSYPEVAKVGLTEAEAKEAGYSVKIGRFPFQAIGKAQVDGDVNGFSKIIVDEVTEDILGIHLVGPSATDMISEASLAKFLNATAWEISKTIHPHPSLSEIYTESALAVDGLQIHG